MSGWPPAASWRRGLPDVAPEAEPLLDLIGAGGSRPALVCPDDDISVTYAELGTAVSDLAGRLRAAGAGRDDRVAVVLANGPEIVAVLFALASMGAAMAPLNPAYTEPEYRFFLADLAPQLVLVGAGAAPAARAAAGGIPIVELLPWEPGTPPRLSAAGDVNNRGQAPCHSRAAPMTSRCCCTRAARRAGPSRCRSCSAT